MMSRHGSVAVVVLAGGSGTRMGGDGNKAYIPLAGRRLLSWSLNTLGHLPEVGRLVLVVRPEDRALATEIVDREVSSGPVELVEGGPTRHASEYAALRHLRPEVDSGDVELVLIHDAARPLVTRTLARSVIAAAGEHGGAIPGLLDEDLVEVTADGCVNGDVRLGKLVLVQTPQVFHAATLLDVYLRAAADGFEGTDTSASIEKYSSLRVHRVEGDPRNVKVTYPQDLFLAERLLAASAYELI